MKDTKSKKKKRRSRAAVKPTTNGLPRGGPEDESKNKNVSSLTEAFEDVSLKEADVDANKTAEILTMLSENSEDPSTTSSVFGGSWGLDSGSSSGSSVGYVETSCVQNTVKKGTSRQKRVVAVTGTVANVLGKEYARASPRKTGKFKEVVDDRNWLDEQEVEQFLCSMLGKDSELSMAVVKDVLGQCGYNVEKVLLSFSLNPVSISFPSDEIFIF
ncbi:SMR domain-containing protein At5g58720-like [Pistacia vera]|uniref:SMR domain-containing protein At5g58720-like n=1 Tax=Pistacia vera TaxID=55513 RepID=UPI001263886A|nr:SMR domain-containing protein At5g58720-like [Pistacia vera]